MILLSRTTKPSARVRGVIALAALTLVTSASTSLAEEDLLSILSGSGAGGVSGEQNLPASPLRKVLVSPSAEQNIFLRFIETREFEKALFQWPTAFEGSAFAKTASGRALNAWVLFKNGIEISAIEALFAIENPTEVAAEIRGLWRETASDSHKVWASVHAPNWHPVWTEVFGVATEVRVRGRQAYKADRLEALKDLIRKAQLGSRERAWLEWQLVMVLAVDGDPAIAARALAHLMTVNNNPVSQDLMTITAARLLYQNGYLDAAVKYYEKVPKSSDHWFEAQEEIGWAYLRKGEPQNSIAVTATLVKPVFTSMVGPETLFLRSLSLLKICDYPGVVATLNLFRSQYRERAKLLLELTERPDSPAVVSLIGRLKNSKVRWTDLGPEAAKLPRFMTRDEVLGQLASTEKAYAAEAARAGDLYARSLSGGTGQVGFQARLEQFRKDVDAKAAAARAATMGRVRALAEEEVQEISTILQKLHIVEAEVLQQVALADRVVMANEVKRASERKGTTGGQGVDRIWFPAESELWFDELANYRVDVKKGCESIKR